MTPTEPYENIRLTPITVTGEALMGLFNLTGTTDEILVAVNDEEKTITVTLAEGVEHREWFGKEHFAIEVWNAPLEDANAPFRYAIFGLPHDGYTTKLVLA